MSGGAVGEYQLQAAIAALHDGAERADDTDWPQIHDLYGLLERITGNPMVTLNRAVAAAMVHGPQTGLDLLAPLEERLSGHFRLDAVRAHLLDMRGDTETAAEHYRAAAARTTKRPRAAVPDHPGGQAQQAKPFRCGACGAGRTGPSLHGRRTK
jgi:predicted RNA polymerase sigma factor